MNLTQIIWNVFCKASQNSQIKSKIHMHASHMESLLHLCSITWSHLSQQDRQMYPASWVLRCYLANIMPNISHVCLFKSSNQLACGSQEGPLGLCCAQLTEKHLGC